MRYLLFGLLFVHAIIHLAGFLKAFGLAEVAALAQPIGRTAGLGWLLAGTILLVAAGLYLTKVPSWWSVALVGIIISQALIFTYWSEAKYGTIANVILLLPVLAAFGADRFSAAVERDRSALLAAAQEARPPVRDPNGLPPPVRRWLSACGVMDRSEPIRTVFLTQHLRMRLTPEQQTWYDGEASQLFSLEPPAFSWAVRVTMNPLVTVYGQDVLMAREAELQMGLYGLWPVSQVSDNPKIDEAALQRYLAEITWFPSAALSPYIEWESVDRRRARATITVGGLAAEGLFEFDEGGRFVRFTTERYRDPASGERTTWIAEADEYGEFGGITVPTRMHATWKLPEGDWTWVHIEVTDLRYTHGGGT
jgi:hypothetical protein